MTIKIGIHEKDLAKSVLLLSNLLADEMTLYVKTRKFHWNVCGESFMELHKLFQNQYTEQEGSIDSIAERINMLGAKSIGTMKEFLQKTRLKESDKFPSQKEMLKELLADNETIIIELRKDIEESVIKNKDAGTIDFITMIMQKHEAAAWILRKYLS
jgi:starvation-inducible DNA-binding protein